jgi:mono/diheme cytochrome c family protein
MEPRFRSSRVRFPFALIAMIAVIGAILEAVWDTGDRSCPPPLSGIGMKAGSRRKGWGEVPVDPRSFPPGDREELAERLYGWNCMPCHGAEGKGDGPVAVRLGLHPRDFTRGIFQLKTSHPDEMPFDDDLFRSISAGLPQGAMPSFADFSVDERWSLVDHVKSLAQLSLPEGRTLRQFDAHPPRRRQPDSAALTGGDPARGAVLFRAGVQCARCHGDDGRGNGPAAAALVDRSGRPVAMPDFTRGEMTFKAGSRPEDVYRALGTGMEGTPMPSFLSLPERDRADLALFVTTLYRPIPPGEKVFLALGCTHCHTVGKGKWVGPDLAGVTRRRSPEWLKKWLKDPPAMISSDEAARAMAKEYPVAMPNLGLAEEDVNHLVEYLVTLPEPAPVGTPK